MRTTIISSKTKRNSPQKPDWIETKRFDIKNVTGIIDITNISWDVAGTNRKLMIEKIKIKRNTR